MGTSPPAEAPGWIERLRHFYPGSSASKSAAPLLAERSIERDEYRQLTEELAFYREWFQKAAEVCDEASRGNLETRLLHWEQVEGLSRLPDAINHLLDMTDAFLREAGAALDHAGDGKFFRRVLPKGMLGSFRSGAAKINAATERLAEDAGVLADLDRRRRELADQFDGTVKRVVSQLGESALRMSEAARTLAKTVGEGDATSAGENSGQLHHVVAGLTQASERIGGVVDLISDVADRTNLLALNATIEAVDSLGKSVHAMQEVSTLLSEQSEELAGSVEAFLQAIRS